MRSSSCLVKAVCHPSDRVSDREIGGVRERAGGSADVRPATSSSASYLVKAACHPSDRVSDRVIGRGTKSNEWHWRREPDHGGVDLPSSGRLSVAMTP
jgi:hypothetical protein